MLSKLSIALILGFGLAFGLTTLLGSFGYEEGYAAGPRYVATTGSDSSNTCLDSANPCATVQHAVDQANPGDEIRVAAGSYNGVSTRISSLAGVVTQTVYISKSISIRGGFTPANWNVSNPIVNPTILDALGEGRVFNIESSVPFLTAISVTIEGLQIINGNAAGQISAFGGFEAGGGVHGASVTATLRNNYISNNYGGGVGGGIALIGDELNLINNIIVSNTVTSTNGSTYGGGVALGMPSGTATLIDNIIRANQAGAAGSAQSSYGGGLYVIGTETVLNDNIIQANQVHGPSGTSAGGGGIYFEGRLIEATNTVVVDNQIVGAGSGNGLFIEFGDAHLRHATIARNSGGDGSGVLVLTGTIHLTNTVLVSHTWGISVETGSAATANSILWFNNSAGNTTGGGAISLVNEFTGDPVFSADGYHIEANSAAVGRGINAGLLTDIDGDTRDPIRPDLGADEVANTSPSSSAIYLPIILNNTIKF